MEEILIVLAGLFGLVCLARTPNRHARGILAAQVLAIGISFVPVRGFREAGLLLYTATLAFFLIYLFARKGLSSWQRALLAVPVFLALLVHVYEFQRYPGAGWLGLSMAVPVVVFLNILFRGRGRFRNEIGVMAIVAADGLVELLRRAAWLAEKFGG